MIIDWILGRCLGCGRGGQRICAQCSVELARARHPTGMWKINDHALPFTLRGIYRWDEADGTCSDRLRSIILSSKGGAATGLTQLWASTFAVTMLREAALRQGCRFTHVVNPPGRSGLWEPDHSGTLGAEVAAVLGLEHFKDVYRATSRGGRQKEKDRAARLSAGHLSVLSEIPREASWLFVDDVAATGGTALRTWTALGKPKRFEAWTIAWRTRQL